MQRFSSRGRWSRSRAQLWPKTCPKPTKTKIQIATSSYEFIGSGGFYAASTGSVKVSIPIRRIVGRISRRLGLFIAARPRPLSRTMQKVWLFRFCDPGPGAPGPPGRAPGAIPGPSRCPRGPAGGPRGSKTNQSKKSRNLKELTEQWSGEGCPSIASPVDWVRSD